MSTFVISDIHGEYEQLKTLLAKTNFGAQDNPHPGCIYRANNHIALDCGAGFKKGRLAGICLETGREYYAKEN